jgi:hypothetical protein
MPSRAGSAARPHYFATQPQVTVPDPRLAAQLTYQVIETTTHTLVIHPREDYPPHAYTHATATMLESYLTNPTHGRPPTARA